MTSTKNPLLAAVLNFLVAGLGSIYLGQVTRGIAWFVGGVIIGAIGYALFPFALTAFAGLYGFAAARDAWNEAQLINRPITPPDILSRPLERPSVGAQPDKAD